MQGTAADHRYNSCQHLGPLPPSAVARLRPGGDPTFLLAVILPLLPVGKGLFQGSKNGYREGRSRGEPNRCYGGEIYKQSVKDKFPLR